MWHSSGLIFKSNEEGWEGGIYKCVGEKSWVWIPSCLGFRWKEGLPFWIEKKGKKNKRRSPKWRNLVFEKRVRTRLVYSKDWMFPYQFIGPGGRFNGRLMTWNERVPIEPIWSALAPTEFNSFPPDCLIFPLVFLSRKRTGKSQLYGPFQSVETIAKVISSPAAFFSNKRTTDLMILVIGQSGKKRRRNKALSLSLSQYKE